MFNRKTHYKWPFSIAMLVYQRIVPIFQLLIHWNMEYGNFPVISRFQPRWCRISQPSTVFLHLFPFISKNLDSYSAFPTISTPKKKNIYIYIYTRNAWAQPRRCSVEVTHSQTNVDATSQNSCRKNNKGTRKY